VKRRNWDYDKIDNLAKEMATEENLLVKKLNALMPAFFSVECHTDSKKGNMARLDAVLYEQTRTRKIPLLDLELEIGKYQKNWNDKLPVNSWVYGLNLLDRKDYGNFDFFIKTSNSFKSAFVVDCAWLQCNIENGRLKSRDIDNRIGFKTCDTFISIPWRIAENSPDGVFLVERDNWDGFFEFLERRFK
jgi:hypothetical protein